MEPSTDGPFNVRERRAAENFARAAQTAGVGRIVYLGGLIPAHGPASAHLASRLAVEEILLGAGPCSVALRASIVIGAGSRSFRFLVRLVERLPVLAVPAWRTNRTNPIDERDVIEMLARAADADGVCGTSLDVGGPDVVTYGELIDRIREHMLVARPTLELQTFTVDTHRQSDRRADRRRGARTDRAADGEPRRTISCSRMIAPPNCSECDCTHSTRRSSTRCASGRRASRWPRADRIVSVPVRR